jgi:hypothetical protein
LHGTSVTADLLYCANRKRAAHRAFATAPMLAARLAIVALAACVAGTAIAADTASSSVDAVKADYLHRITAFVDWPIAVFEAADSPLVLCIAGHDAVGQIAVETTSGQTYAMRPIVVRRVSQPTALARCHMLYVAGVPDDAIAAYFERVRDKPVLTVSDDSRNARTRGVVNFVVRDDRVRFEVNLALAARQRLALSSKLAAVAVRVTPQP